MSARKWEDAHGLSPRVQSMMDRLDAGASESAIAAELNIEPGYVRWCNKHYGTGLLSEAGRVERAIRRGDRDYREALDASGGRFR